MLLAEKGRPSNSLLSAKLFQTEDYYSLLQQTVQSTTADYTVHYNGLYGPLPKSVIICPIKRLNQKDEKA